MKNISFINRIIGYFQWKFGKFQFRVALVKNNPNPEDIKANIVYIVGGGNYVKWAYLRCPDNCGDNIMLNLSVNRKPLWSVVQDKKGRATIYPSIYKLDGCKSHFWIKNGKLIWT